MKSQLEGNLFASDHVRLAVMASLILAGKDNPDVILLQEVGLSRLTSNQCKLPSRAPPSRAPRALGPLGALGAPGGMPDIGGMPGSGSMPSSGSMPDIRCMPSSGSMPDIGCMPDARCRPDIGACLTSGAGLTSGASMAWTWAQGPLPSRACPAAHEQYCHMWPYLAFQ